MSPDASAGREGRARVRTLLGLSAGAALLLLAGALSLPEEGEASLRPTSLGAVVATTSRALAVTPAPSPGARARALPEPAASIPPAATGEALSAALNEERVVLTSSAVIEGIDTDRPWVCTGEPMTLSARVGGVQEPEAVQRWVWPGSETGAELHPGARLPWRAPATAGRYFVRFQVCKDLGGRRVGVLAEQVVGIDVRACGRGEGQEADALRVEVTQRGPSAFEFRAVSAGAESLAAYAWDFGDGTSAVTPGPTASHSYDTGALGVQDVRAFTVRLSARGGGGAARAATAFVQVRGQPPPDAPPLATLEVERAQAGSSGEGWRTEVKVRVPEEGDITWEHVERLTVRWDDQVDVVTRAWREVITVEESWERGGFRGHVTVRASEVPPDVKQVVDSLHGRDATGREVVLSWASVKREAAPAATGTPDRPPLK
jgi:hypothetical protein